MAKNQKVENWDLVLAEYEKRDSTQSEFCSQRGINPATLSYQLTRRNKSAKPAFVPLALEGPSIDQEILLEFPSGLRLSIRG